MHKHTHTHTHIYIYVCLCVCVCVCVCVRARRCMCMCLQNVFHTLAKCFVYFIVLFSYGQVGRQPLWLYLSLNFRLPCHLQGSSTERWSRNTPRVVAARVFYILRGVLTSPFILNNSMETAASFNVVSHPRCCEPRN